ncbi:MAG: PorV/PorQ family protein [Spirochaetia bacterium]|nr:PorV/PorQ family protein [Spirochaetia bacterium]
MKSFVKKIFLLLVFLFIVKNLASDPLFLTMPIDAEGQALSGAKTSNPDGVSAIIFNPAGLGFTDQSEVAINHYMLGGTLSADSFLMNYPFSNFFSLGFSASSLYLNEPIKMVENFQETDVSLSLVDVQFGLSVGYRILENFSLGLSARYFRLQLGPQVAQSVGADVGFLYKFNIIEPQNAYKRWGFGLALKNMGPDFSFYGGGYEESQPFEVQFGVTYEHPQWFITSIEYAYSLYEGNRFHWGLEFMPQYYISPKFGLQKDFGGFSFSLGGALNYGSSWKLNALAGTMMSNSSQTDEVNSFFSLMFQRKMYGAKKRKPSTEIREDMDLEDIDSIYSKYNMVPFTSGFRVEKIQGVLLEEKGSAGYLKKITRLKRVAVQPEDEILLQNASDSRFKKLIVGNRKISIWLDLRELSLEKPVEVWDLFASIAESRSNVEIMTGWDLESLNENTNSPLRVEFRLEAAVASLSEKKQELRTVLYELYNGSIIAAKNFSFSSDNDIKDAWHEAATFYASYLKNIEGFYEYRIEKVQAKIENEN